MSSFLCIFFSLLLCVSSVASAFFPSASPLPDRSYPIQVHQELGCRLSGETEIYFPKDTEFANYTAHWSEATAPDIAVVVVPSSKEDVAKTVRHDP